MDRNEQIAKRFLSGEEAGHLIADTFGISSARVAQITKNWCRKVNPKAYKAATEASKGRAGFTGYPRLIDLRSRKKEFVAIA